jgi:hypothetical protein
MPKVNPILFDSLDQYTQYVNSQREKGSSAPFCFQQENDTQGQRRLPNEGNAVLRGGLPPIQMTMEQPNTADPSR